MEHELQGSPSKEFQGLVGHRHPIRFQDLARRHYGIRKKLEDVLFRNPRAPALPCCAGRSLLVGALS